MEVLNARESLLSNFEVLALLSELDADFHTKTKMAQRVKKEEEAANASALTGNTTNVQLHHRAYNPLEDISENLRTIEVEAIQYLSADYQPTRRQSAQGITKLVKALEPYGLTKAEKLQVINLAPTETVELYVLVEDPDERIGHCMDEILDKVRVSLAEDPTNPEVANNNGASVLEPLEGSRFIPSGHSLTATTTEDLTAGWDSYDVRDDEYMDDGDGAGVEGDLDMEDD